MLTPGDGAGTLWNEGPVGLELAAAAGGMMTAATPRPSTDERPSDEDVRARHRNDDEGMARTEEVLDQVREGTASEDGIAGEALRDFLRERT